MLEIDGSYGEGGGQIVRTCLSLSMVTRTPFRIKRIRAGREKPGLRKQHLTAIKAAAQICAARVKGDTLNSDELSFEPAQASSQAASYYFNIGTAGSTTLVLQTILFDLIRLEGKSTVRLVGGTHNPFAPTTDFLINTFIPALNLLGPRLTARVEKYGFYPRGGGELLVEIEPCPILEPMHLKGSKNYDPSARILLAHLPEHIARREALVIEEKLGKPLSIEVEITKNSLSPGNTVHIFVDAAADLKESGKNEQSRKGFRETFVGLGRRGLKAECVAEAATEQYLRYRNSGAAVGEYLADQLLLPLALAGAGSFTTLKPSRHTTTNVNTIEKFLPVQFTIEETGFDLYSISVSSGDKN